MNIPSEQQEMLQDFELLADYLLSDPAATIAPSYRSNLSAFLLHAQHVAAYDLAEPYLHDKQVLEIGCFIGYGSLNLAGKAREVISIDIDERALAGWAGRF